MDDQFPKEKLPVLSMGMCFGYVYMTTKYSWVLDSQTPDNFDEKRMNNSNMFSYLYNPGKKYNPDNIVLFLFFISPSIELTTFEIVKQRINVYLL